MMDFQQMRTAVEAMNALHPTRHGMPAMARLIFPVGGARVEIVTQCSGGCRLVFSPEAIARYVQSGRTTF